MKEYIDYVEINPQDNKTGFSIKTKYSIQKGFLFWITRKLWSLEARGKNWQEISFYAAFFLVLFPIGIVADVIVLVLFGIIKLLFFILKRLMIFLQDIAKAFFTKMLYPTFRNIFSVIIIIGLLIIMIYRFELIKDIILKFFDLIIK